MATQVIWKVTYFTGKWRNEAKWYDFWRSILCLSTPPHISCSIGETSSKRINISFFKLNVDKKNLIAWFIHFLGGNFEHVTPLSAAPTHLFLELGWRSKALKKWEVTLHLKFFHWHWAKVQIWDFHEKSMSFKFRIPRFRTAQKHIVPEILKIKKQVWQGLKLCLRIIEVNCSWIRRHYSGAGGWGGLNYISLETSLLVWNFSEETSYRKVQQIIYAGPLFTFHCLCWGWGLGREWNHPRPKLI